MLAAGAAQADGTADEADLQFRLGEASFRKGDLEGALEHFFASNRLAPNRNVLFNIGSVLERMKRWADAHRYYTDAAEGETDPEALKAAQGALGRITPRVALLEVVSDPPGATLYIDRKSLGSVGRAPHVLAMPPGKYTVLAELEGFDPVSSGAVEAKVGARTRVPLVLQRIVGKVQVQPRGVPSMLVTADEGKARCEAPCELSLPPGVHELAFEAKDFRAPPRTVTISAGETVVVVAVLAPVTGSVLVEADEPSALVSIDGQPAGFTPAVIQNVPVGRRTVRVSKRGFEPVETVIEVKADQQSRPEEAHLVPQREIVAASRYGQAIEDAPASVSVITSEELRAFGYPTIADALHGMRGFTISNDRAYPSASVRGLGQPEDYGNRLLVLQDGHSLNDDVDNASAIGSNARTDLGDVERIEVVRGPGSLLYGTGALSGVVNLVTRPRDEPDSAQAGFGVYDGVALHGRAGFMKHFGQDGALWASVSGARSDGLDLVVPVVQDASVVPTPISSVDAFHSFGTAGRVFLGALTAQWFYHRRDQTDPVGAYATAVGDTATHLRDQRMTAELKFEPQLTATTQLLLRAHADRYVSHELFASDPRAVEDYQGTWYGGEARLIVTPLPQLRLMLGGEAQAHPEVKLHGQTQDGAPPYLDESTSFRFGALYALADAAPRDWLRLNAGARLDVYSTFGAIVVPRAALIVKPLPGGTLKLMGGRAFRAPSIYEQVYNDAGATQAKAVDPARGLDLGPESIWSGEAEYSQRFFTDWVALLGGHYSSVNGFITIGPDAPGSTVVRFQNSPDDVQLKGLDVELRRDLHRQVMLSASYSYQSATRTAEGKLVNAPEHLACLKGLAPLIPDQLLLGVRLTLEAPRRISAGSDAETRGAAVADVTLSGTVREPGLSWTLGVYNLADQKYDVPVSTTFASRTLPQNGRTLLFNVEARLP